MRSTCSASFHFALGLTSARISVWLPLNTTVFVGLVAAIFPSVQIKVLLQHVVNEWSHHGTTLVGRVLEHEKDRYLGIVHRCECNYPCMVQIRRTGFGGAGLCADFDVSDLNACHPSSLRNEIEALLHDRQRGIAYA